MKKSIILLVIAMSLFALDAFAELKEVRGVQTRCVSYENDYDETEWGYELKNENNYPVWVELELRTSGFSYEEGYRNIKRINEGVKDTKSIKLNANETYIWRCGGKMSFNTYISGVGFRYLDYHGNFYLVYKAYKAE